MKTLAIIGSGDLGQQFAHYAVTDGHYGSVVFFDDFTTEETVNGCWVIGKTDDIEQAFKAKKFDELLIGIGYKHLRVKAELFDRFSGKIPFGKIIHSTSWLDPTAVVEPGAVIYPRCDIDAKVTIGANAILNIGCTIAHDSVVGKHSFLSPRVAVAGFTTIGEQCIVGINATIIDNLTIAAQTQIGGGAVVIKSIIEKGLYVGNPAKFIRS